MKKAVRDIFDANKLFDWWSVPHFMFGIVTALMAISFSWSPVYVFGGTLVAALLWELLEKYVRLSEAPGNGWVDVVLPLLSFVTTWILIDRATLNHERHLGLLLITTLLYLFINMIAWRARFEKDEEFLG
jgi:hypothetical protein